MQSDNAKIIVKSFHISQIFLMKKRGGGTTNTKKKMGVGLRSSQLIMIQGWYVLVQIFYLCVVGVTLSPRQMQLTILSWWY